METAQAKSKELKQGERDDEPRAVRQLRPDRGGPALKRAQASYGEGSVSSVELEDVGARNGAARRAAVRTASFSTWTRASSAC